MVDIIGCGDAVTYIAYNRNPGAGFVYTIPPTPPAMSVTTTSAEELIRDFCYYQTTWPYYAGSWRVENHPRFVARLNNRYRVDLVGFDNYGVKRHGAFEGSEDTAMADLEWREFGYNDGWRVNEHPRLAGDVSGDGLDDIVGFANAGVILVISR